MIEVLADAATGLVARPARSALTALGTAVGVASLVATVGLSTSAAAQVAVRFDRLVATEVRVSPVPEAETPGARIEPGGLARGSALNGVRALGLRWSVGGEGTTHQVAARADRSAPAAEVPVVAATAGYLEAARVSMAEGRRFDAGHAARHDRVALLGPSVADRLGLADLRLHPTVFADGVAFMVIGVLGDTERDADLLGSIVVPWTAAERVWGPPIGDEVVLADTDLGAAQQVGEELPVALLPQRAEALRAFVPPDPTRLRDEVSTDVNGLVLVIGVVALLAGALSIANTTLVAVLERRGEIGMRRALGASRLDVGSLFLLETGALGALGGLVGAAVGVLVVLVTALARQWSAVLDLRLVFLGPVIGAVVGVLAGTYPAWRAARLDPAEALRS